MSERRSHVRIAGRLALQSAVPLAGLGYHGCDVVVRQISETGFEAEVKAKIEAGSLVRLKLPGSGVMLARVASSQPGRLSAKFLNPVTSMRLSKTVGMAVAA